MNCLVGTSASPLVAQALWAGQTTYDYEAFYTLAFIPSFCFCLCFAVLFFSYKQNTETFAGKMIFFLMEILNIERRQK